MYATGLLMWLEQYSTLKFIRNLLKYLEPRMDKQRTILINELDEFLDIIFYTKGMFKVGYKMNMKERYVIPYKPELKGHLIGAYSVINN